MTPPYRWQATASRVVNIDYERYLRLKAAGEAVWPGPAAARAVENNPNEEISDV